MNGIGGSWLLILVSLKFCPVWLRRSTRPPNSTFPSLPWAGRVSQRRFRQLIFEAGPTSMQFSFLGHEGRGSAVAALVSREGSTAP